MAPREDAAQAVSDALDQVPEPKDRELALQARRTKAVSMALAGLSDEQVGRELGISTSGARELIARTLEDTRNYQVDQMRQVENARLDRAQAAIWSEVLKGDLKAINAFIRISERRSRMNGLDAPSKIQMSVSVKAEMHQALAELEEILDAEVVEEAETDVVALEEAAAMTHEPLVDPMLEEA